tara:strand:+ start:1607 stop:1966 length:360 start_codon:yes stop_codon:yes gene_type:complete
MLKNVKYVKKGTTMHGGFDYDSIMCDSIDVESEANRFFKMKCYKHKSINGRIDMEDKFQIMIQELIEDYILTRNKKKYNAFNNYIRRNYKRFGPFSKEVVRVIYTRFQEEAVPTMDFIF